MVGRMIKRRCVCKHSFQDKLYGKQIRAMNRVDDGKAEWRCTVCGREYISASSKKSIGR